VQMLKTAGNRWRRKSRNWNSRQSIRGHEGERRVEGVVDNETQANPVIIVAVAVVVAVAAVNVVIVVVVVVVKALYFVRQSKIAETW
jgi:uncharacterized membrane protein